MPYHNVSPQFYDFAEIRKILSLLLRITTDPIIGGIKSLLGSTIVALLDAIPAHTWETEVSSFDHTRSLIDHGIDPYLVTFLWHPCSHVLAPPSLRGCSTHSGDVTAVYAAGLEPTPHSLDEDHTSPPEYRPRVLATAPNPYRPNRAKFGGVASRAFCR